jgi:hypothetical protein
MNDYATSERAPSRGLPGCHGSARLSDLLVDRSRLPRIFFGRILRPFGSLALPTPSLVHISLIAVLGLQLLNIGVGFICGVLAGFFHDGA